MRRPEVAICLLSYAIMSNAAAAQVKEKESLDERVKDLRQRSEQLQQYSRLLKERSQEISRRFQACVNSKRAA